MTGDGRFEGRVCLVTGSTGLAASAGRAMAAEGGRVFVVSKTPEHGRDLVSGIEAHGGRAAFHPADLTVEPDVEAAVAACVDTFGRVDVVYNVAGISGRRFGDGPLHEATLAGWETVLAANVTSVFLVSRAAVRQLLAQDPRPGGERGVVLNMSSVLASHPAPVHFATHGYAASKGAIESFSRSIASYYAPHGIRINVIAPSLVATPMSRRARADPAIVAYLAVKQPLAGGPMDTDGVTPVALHLLSDEARMVTGQVVTVDGGWSVS